MLPTIYFDSNAETSFSASRRLLRLNRMYSVYEVVVCSHNYCTFPFQNFVMIRLELGCLGLYHFLPFLDNQMAELRCDLCIDIFVNNCLSTVLEHSSGTLSRSLLMGSGSMFLNLSRMPQDMCVATAPGSPLPPRLEATSWARHLLKDDEKKL
jgi:hypothetical protein